MRKRIIGSIPKDALKTGANWLLVEQIATVEVTSEESSHPIEQALLDGETMGWVAALPGEQTIRLIFDNPQQIKVIQLLFIEREVERSQEFVLRWSPDGGRTFQEIVRQQWNFNPSNAAEEIEEYQVELRGVTLIELKIVPNMNGGDARASLAKFRLA